MLTQFCLPMEFRLTLMKQHSDQKEFIKFTDKVILVLEQVLKSILNFKIVLHNCRCQLLNFIQSLLQMC